MSTVNNGVHAYLAPSSNIKSSEVVEVICALRIEDMEAMTKYYYICSLMFLVILGNSELAKVDGAGECGRSTTPDREALKLAPCSSAAQDETASVSEPCCAQVKKIGQNPACLCAVMLSNTAKISGARPEVAVTIPKRCNISDRPVGYKCGAYTVP